MDYQISKSLVFGFIMQKEKVFPNYSDVFKIRDIVFCLEANDGERYHYLVLNGEYQNKDVPSILEMKKEDRFVLIIQKLESLLENLKINEDNYNFDFIRDSLLEKVDSKFYWYSFSKKQFNVIKDKKTIQAIIDSERFDQDDEEIEEISLDSFGDFLDEKDYVTDPAVGRDAELHQLIIALLSQEKSALLVGPPGVGKTALVEGLAYRLQRGELPKALANYRILKVNISRLLSGTRYRGDFEEKVENLFYALQENPNVLLFIDELHTAIGAGSSTSSNLDFANILKPYLDRGQFKVIGATTEKEYDLYINQDPALKRRFKKIDIKEPNEETLRFIFDSVMDKLAKKTNLSVPFDDDDKALLFTYLLKVTEKARRVYDDMLFNPDLALSIMDTAFACALASNQKSIEIENFVEAMRLENRIYPTTRNLLANELLVQYDDLQQEKEPRPSIVFEKPKQKVILFDQLT